ncbi:hypothetical protein QYE76_046428 [Lolium multiflorum]|uniref:Transposase (putative) gypsy type domain-containing protein n=1 Tax=Lolium multiflorum TaxID=4521 RepID=A0AAD8TM23_LOLMU|nr:hypothetical protein QYE76_046428 [Lolium multiflorum]
MPPRTKLTKHIAPGTNAPMDKAEISGWERSKISNQDQKTLKRLGLLKKQDSLIFPGDESFPRPPIEYRVTFIDHLIRGLSAPIHEFLRGLLFVYGIQLHQLTPNSILHISIFITLCKCFLGTHPHWGLWKRIFYLQRNNSRNIVYNLGGICICVRPDVDYFDVKFTDSIQGWRKRWLYIQDECENSHEVQPLQARKNPLWMYSGEKDVDRLSEDLSVKDLEKPIRRFSSLSKKHEVSSSFRVEPYNGSHAIPEGHQILSSLPLPVGGEVDERAVVTNDSQETSRPESEAAGSQKSAASSQKETKLERSDSGRSVSPPLAVSPRHKRKRKDIKDPGTSKPTESAAEEPLPEEEPLMKHLVNLGSQFIGFRDEADGLKDALRRAEERVDALAAKLELSEKSREKAEADAAAAEDLRQRLQTAENDLSDKIAHQIARENAKQIGRMGEEFTLHEGVENRLLDTLSILGLQGDLARTNISNARAAFKHLFPHFFPKQTQPEIFSELVQHFLGQDDPALAYRQDNLKIGVEGTIALVADNQQDVDWMKVGSPKGMNKEKWKALVKDAKPQSKKILAFLSPKPTTSASTAKTEVK